MTNSTIVLINAHAEELKKALVKANWKALLNKTCEYRVYLSEDGEVTIREYLANDSFCCTGLYHIATLCRQREDGNAPREQHTFKENINQYFADCVRYAL